MATFVSSVLKRQEGMSSGSSLLKYPRALVSENRRRYQKEGYDLDLSYIHPRIIVMGYPAVGAEILFRNPRSEVRQFLEEHHLSHYHVYNFCLYPSRQYPASDFDGHVGYYPVEDHNVLHFETLLQYCDDAARWLDADAENVVALHCQAGKGRAGMMACMLLVRMGFASSAQEAIDTYNRERVTDGRGLTVQSQKKWVGYFARLQKLLRDDPDKVPRPMVEPTYKLQQVQLCNLPTAQEPPVLILRVFQLSSDDPNKTLLHQMTGSSVFDVNVQVQGSVQLEFRRYQCGRCMYAKHVNLWFNTFFVTPDERGIVVFQRDELDWVHKDKKQRRFPNAMELQLTLDKP